MIPRVTIRPGPIDSPRRARHASLALAALAALATGAAWAQGPAPAGPRSAPPMATPAAPVFPIRGFRIEGDNPLGEADAQRVLAPFVRADATLQTLQQATAALEAELRANG